MSPACQLITPPRARTIALAALTLFLIALPLAEARLWLITGHPQGVEANYVGQGNGFILIRGETGAALEVPATAFAPADQEFLQALATAPQEMQPLTTLGKTIETSRGYEIQEKEKITGQFVELPPTSELHLTSASDPLPGSWIHFKHSDSWLFFENLSATQVIADLLDRFLVNDSPAVLDQNIRIVRYREGSVVIPQGPAFPALTVFGSGTLAGQSLALDCYRAHNAKTLQPIEGAVGSFILKRGYTATLAQNANGTGVSRNYVAQDHDLIIKNLPDDLADQVRFIRVFPWFWSTKKGIAGNITEKLKLGWYYNWNLNQTSSPDLEYVAIKQKEHWPNLNQNWKERKINHLLGFNEPDKEKQANMTIEQAIKAWPNLLRTGLRVGSPSTSDGGLDWLYGFMKRAEEENFRVDFVAVHYYRAVDPKNPEAAAERFYNFLKTIHDRVQRPLWVTEWNNGANWTDQADPTPKQQARCVAAMVEMLEETEFVERYALYNWVEPSRQLVDDDGNLSPAGIVYRDIKSNMAYTQSKQ